MSEVAERNDALCGQLQEAFLGEFPADRVVTLLGYGSMVDGRSTNSDIDVYLLLDEVERNDTVHARNAAAQFTNEIDLTLHYADELPESPRKFRLGKKSCLALAYLASAELLHGTNVPADMFEDLSERDLQVSTLHAVFYYLGQMRKEMSSAATDSGTMARQMDKYLSRQLIDAMLFYNKTTFEPFKHLLPEQIIELARGHDQLGRIFEGQPAPLADNLDKLETMQHVHEQLRLANWLICRTQEQSMKAYDPGLTPESKALSVIQRKDSASI